MGRWVTAQQTAICVLWVSSTSCMEKLGVPKTITAPIRTKDLRSLPQQERKTEGIYPRKMRGRQAGPSAESSFSNQAMCPWTKDSRKKVHKQHQEAIYDSCSKDRLRHGREQIKDKPARWRLLGTPHIVAGQALPLLDSLANKAPPSAQVAVSLLGTVGLRRAGSRYRISVRLACWIADARCAQTQLDISCGVPLLPTPPVHVTAFFRPPLIPGGVYYASPLPPPLRHLAGPLCGAAFRDLPPDQYSQT
jgi:hypothetical protein